MTVPIQKDTVHVKNASVMHTDRGNLYIQQEYALRLQRHIRFKDTSGVSGFLSELMLTGMSAAVIRGQTIPEREQVGFFQPKKKE